MVASRKRRPSRRVNLLAVFLHAAGAPWWLLPDGDEKRLAYYRSWRWWGKRCQVWERAAGVCEWCGAPGHDAHHRSYKRLYSEPLSDLVLLCRRCHLRAHGRL